MTWLTHERVSKVVAHALRHEPWLYELELDEAGWVPVDQLLDALHAKGGSWRALTEADLAAMIAASSKTRYELTGHRIRALYGHSTPQRLDRVPAVPPSVLFHGTSPLAWVAIQVEGLRPMRRQYAHLSVDEETAVRTDGARTTIPSPSLAAGAASEGVHFYRGNDLVWLADWVPARFLSAPREAVLHGARLGAVPLLAGSRPRHARRPQRVGPVA